MCSRFYLKQIFTRMQTFFPVFFFVFFSLVCFFVFVFVFFCFCFLATGSMKRKRENDNLLELFFPSLPWPKISDTHAYTLQRLYYENRFNIPITSFIQRKTQVVHWQSFSPKRNPQKLQVRRFRSSHPCDFQIYSWR